MSFKAKCNKTRLALVLMVCGVAHWPYTLYSNAFHWSMSSLSPHLSARRPPHQQPSAGAIVKVDDTWQVKNRLLRSYYSSTYGSVLWYIGDKCVNELCTEWRKGLRRIWNLPSDAHCDSITGLSGGMSTLDELCRWSLSFVAKVFVIVQHWLVLLHIMV